MPKALTRPPPLDWAKVVAGLIGVAFASWVLGVFLDVMNDTQGSPWTILLGITGSVSPISVGIYLRVKQPHAFHKFLRFFESLGTQHNEEPETKIEANASGSGRASAAVARDNANQINILGDYYAGPPHREVTIREREPTQQEPTAPSEVREPKKKRDQSADGLLVANTTVVLKSGHYESWPIEAATGDRLRGTIESDGTLNALLLSEEDYADYVEEDDYEPEDALGEDRKFIPVNAEIPHDGTWYLVIEVYGKQNPRTVTVRVRHKTTSLAKP